ncbi:hypothetical protein J6TS7_32350 [Paenibacillus dendritiformis]|uniref:hypothetical protein n=1 Tax=Paenibacillus TaxID=44249 RepID=UPI001B24ADED|nr:hypothetical protein [Paenibacillus dendritiformis]GIO79625.1 hypothetical protein J6TS7_32350 [Paenibacillus dendritiformis]
MNKKDTRLLPYIVEFETILQTYNLTDEEHDLKLSAIMTQMEKQFGVPFLNNDHYNKSFPECIALYKSISNARVTLGEEGVFQLGNKVKIVDGLQSRGAKAYETKDLDTSIWYLCIDQTGKFGYAFDKNTIEWDGTEFVYDCKKWNTPLKTITEHGY